MKPKVLYTLFFITLGFVFLKLLLPNRITSISISSNSSLSTILVKQTHNIKPKIVFLKSEDCWIIDFYKTSVDKMLLKKTFSNHIIKMCFLSYPKKPTNMARLRIYTCHNATMKITERNNDLLISIGKSKLSSVKQLSNNAISLFNPFDKQLSPVVIDVKKNSLYPILNKLAENIGIKLKFKNKMPDNISLKLEASDSAEAIRGIASLLGISIEVDGNIWALKSYNKVCK